MPQGTGYFNSFFFFFRVVHQGSYSLSPCSSVLVHRPCHCPESDTCPKNNILCRFWQNAFPGHLFTVTVTVTVGTSFLVTDTILL